LLLCVGAALAASGGCSASSGAPAVLSDCTPIDDASCAANPSGGGGGSSGGSRDSGTSEPDGGGEPEDAGTCGAASSVLNAANNQCPVCISTSCCLAAAACTGQCLQLLTCPAGSINSCEASNPQGVGAYNDLASCLVQSCATQCPTLPMATAGDF
jgi:hypothetical protein